MKEEDVVVVSSDSEEDEEIVWMRKNQNKQYQILSEKIRPILYYQVQPGYKKSIRFPYDKFQEFANDFQKSLDLVNTESTKAFIWKNLIRWIVSIKLCYENITDCINDRCYNLILTDLMAQYINYKCKLNSSIGDETEVSRVTNDIILTLNLVFSGWVPGILMTLLKIDVIDEYQLILYPIFRKYLSNKHLHETSDFISYLRLILCFRKWKKLTHLKEDKEIINEIAVGKSLKALNSDVIDLSTETVDMPVLPRTVPAVNEDNREFAKINGLIDFAMKHRETGTRILLISKTFELDDAIEQFFKQYSEYINRWTPKLLDVSKWEIKPTLIEDLTRSPSPSDQLRESSEIANKLNINGKQGTKAVDQHLSINCDTSSISVYNKLNNLSISSHSIENLSLSFKNNQQNRNSDAVLSSNNNNVIDLETEDDDEDVDEDDEGENKPMSAYEKQVFDVIEKLKKRAIVVGELLNRVNTEKINNPPVILDISSDETRQSSAEVPAVPVPLVPVPSVPVPVPTARNNIEVPVATNSDPIRASLNLPNVPVEKHIRKRHGIVSSTTSFEGTGDDSDHSDDYDGFGVPSRVLLSQRPYSKVVEEATSSTNEISKTHSNVNSQPRSSISSSPCPTRPSSPSPDRWSNFSPSSTIRSGSSSRLGIVSGTSSLTAGRSTSSINDGEMPTCSRYVAIPASAPTLPNKDNTSQKDHNIELNNKESATSINVIESNASTPKKSETEEHKLPSHPTSDPDSPLEETPIINKLTDLEVRTCSVRELLKNISGFIGDSQEEYGFKSSKGKCGPDESLIEISLTSTNVKNKSIEKTEPNLSQIKVGKTLDGVEKDTNTRKEVENQVKVLKPQQLKVLPKIDTINESKNSNNSSEIVEEENSRRLIEKPDLETSNDISCHPQLDIDKKSTKVKEVTNTENKKDSTSTNVKNKSIGSANAEKTEANLSQIKVGKTLDGVEKDTNTRKEVENQVKALIPQQLKVPSNIDTINESKNSNTSSEIVEEENSRRLIEKPDLETSNDISCHPQLDIDKKSTKVKEVTNTENKKDSTSTNVKNKSIGSANAEKTEANLSQIKVGKTLDGVEKDTNTRKEVENQVKALIPQQLKVPSNIDTINESKNSNTSLEIVEEENSRRLIEKPDLETSNDISCHPQLDIDKKSTKVKEVTNTENKKDSTSTNVKNKSIGSANAGKTEANLSQIKVGKTLDGVEKDTNTRKEVENQVKALIPQQLKVPSNIDTINESKNSNTSLEIVEEENSRRLIEKPDLETSNDISCHPQLDIDKKSTKVKEVTNTENKKDSTSTNVKNKSIGSANAKKTEANLSQIKVGKTLDGVEKDTNTRKEVENQVKALIPQQLKVPSNIDTINKSKNSNTSLEIVEEENSRRLIEKPDLETSNDISCHPQLDIDKKSTKVKKVTNTENKKDSTSTNVKNKSIGSANAGKTEANLSQIKVGKTLDGVEKDTNTRKEVENQVKALIPQQLKVPSNIDTINQSKNSNTSLEIVEEENSRRLIEKPDLETSNDISCHPQLDIDKKSTKVKKVTNTENKKDSTSTNVKNKSIGSANAEKTEANLSQIKVGKTLDGVEKDTNTRKEVENQVKALIPQQLKVPSNIDTINQSKNSNTSLEIVEEENSRRLIEKPDLETSNDISCHPQLDIDKKSTKVKEVTNTENKKDSTSTNVKNKSIGSANAEKTEANLSQIKVGKTLDGVEKDTNTRKEVENQVKALIPQQLKVPSNIDTINESKNSNTSLEIVEEENSRRLIEKPDLETSNDISCHPQLDIDKKSTKVKKVTNTENKKDSTSTNVKNKSIGSANAGKTEANLSQIKVGKTLDVVEKDTNTRKEVENQVKALIPQQLKVPSNIDTINQSKNSNTSLEIVEEENSRRLIEKPDLETSNDISCHPQLEIDKKSTKVKEVTNTENKKVFDQPNELEKVESIFKISIKESENDIESVEDNSNTLTKEAVGELSKAHVEKSKSIVEHDNSFEEDESLTDDIESPPYEPICQNESLEIPDISSETDNKETQTNKEQTSQPIENSSAENENGFGAQNVQKDCISNCQKGDQANKPTIVEQVSEPNRAEDIILTSQDAIIEKLSDNQVKKLSQNELIDQKETNAKTNQNPSDDGKLKINEIVKSDHDYVTVDYLGCSNNDHAFDELKKLQSFMDSPKSSDFETSTKDTSCSDQILKALNEDIEPIDRVTNEVTELQILENEEKKDYEQFFRTIEKQIIHDKGVNEEQFLGSQRYSSCDGNLIDKTAETLESLTSSSKENIEDQCVNRKSCLDTSLTLLESQLNSESTILHQEETGNQNIETVEKQLITKPESVLRKTSLGLPADIGFDVEGITERGEDAKPENLQKDKAIDDQIVVDDNDINENQSTAQKLSCDDNTKSIGTELYTEVLFSSIGEDKEHIYEAKTKNAMETPDVHTNDENQDLTEQTTSTEKQNSKSNEIEKDQLVIQEPISNTSVNLINRELIKNDKECEQLVEQTLENQSSNIENVNKEKLGFVEEANEKKSDRNTHNKSPEVQKSETNKKQTVPIQKVNKNDFYTEEISSFENVTQNKKETTEHSANHSEDICTTEQNKIGEIVFSTPRVVHSSLEVLTPTEDESTLYNKVIDDESFLKDNPEEKISTMGETDSTESINKSQMLFNDIFTSPAEDKKKRKLIIRIARLSILEEKLVRADSLSKIETLNEQKLEDLKSIEESGEYQIKRHTSRKIQKQSRKKITKALKKQALQEIILEKVKLDTKSTMKTKKTAKKELKKKKPSTEISKTIQDNQSSKLNASNLVDHKFEKENYENQSVSGDKSIAVVDNDLNGKLKSCEEHEYEYENTIERMNTEMCCSNSAKTNSEVEKTTPCLSKVDNLELINLGIVESSSLPLKDVDAEDFRRKNINTEEHQDVSETSSENIDESSLLKHQNKDETKRKLIIRIPKMLVSTDELPKNNIKSSKKGSKANKVFSTLISKILEKEEVEELLTDDDSILSTKEQEFSESIDIQVKKEIITDEGDKHQTNERESNAKKINARLEDDEETRTKTSSKMNKAKGSEIPQTKTLGKNMVESIPVLKLSPEQEIENLDISKTNVSNESLIEPIEIQDDLMICINKKLQKAKKKNKKTGAKSKAKKLKIDANELTVVKDSTFATYHDKDHISNASECISTQSDHHQTDSEENIKRVKSDKPKPKAIVENVIGHKSFVKAILEEYIKESSKNTAASSIEIPISKSVDNDEPKLLKTSIEVSEKTNINNLQENTSETEDFVANAIQLNKKIRKTSTEELKLKKKKTTIKANTSFESIEESTPSTEIQTLKVKEENVEVDNASTDSLIKNAECQTEPKSTIKTYIQPCSSKCSKFSNASSTKQLDLKNGQTNILKNIVELKDDLVKNRNQEVFTQITCAKQQNSMEPDSSSQLAIELQRTENTLTEEESNLSTRVQVEDHGEPSVISDSEISQQNASIALESDKSIVFYPSRDSAEDQEVSSITSKTNESGNTTYYNYNDENGTPVMDEKNTPEEDSPSSQCKIISLSKIRVPTSEVHEITALLLSQSKEPHTKPLTDTIEPEAESHPICFEKVEKCNANPEESTTPSCDAPDESFELGLKKIGISKNCASSGNNFSLSPSKSIRYSSENQKNDRKQKRPQRVQKLEADPTDQKCFNFDDLNAAAILTSLKAQQKKNTRPRKRFQPTRITRSQIVDQAQAILLHDSETEQYIPSMSCPQSQCEKDPLENLELPRSNISSDSDDAGKLVIDLDTKKANKKQKPKQIKKEKAPPKKNNKAVKKITFNPIVEVFEASSPDVFESRRTRTRSSRGLLTYSPIPVSNRTKSTKGTPKPKNSGQNNTENDAFVDRVKISKTPIKKGKLRISFDESLENVEQPTIINETYKESYPNISNYTPHNMNQETWLKNLTLRKTSKSLDLEVEQILENVSMSRKVLSEPDLLKAPKIDITFLQTKPTVCENDLEDQNKTESKNETFELDQIPPIKVSPKIETLRTYKQLKGKNLNKCTRPLSMEDNAKEDEIKANKSISRKRTTISDLIKPSKLQKKTKLSKDSIASPVSFSETVKCDLITSTPKTTTVLVLEQENGPIFTFTGTNIDKNGKDTKKSNVEKVETIADKNNTSMEVTSFNKVEKHYTSTSKEAKKSNKTAKSLKQKKKPKILIKEATLLEDSIEPVTPLIDTLSESVKSSVTYSIPELKQENQFFPLAEIKIEKEDVEENAPVEKAASMAEVFPTKTDLAIVNEVEKQVKSITIKGKKSTKTRTYSIVDLKKSSKKTKTTNLTKEPKLFEDLTAPTTQRNDSPSKTVELSITKSIHEVEINIDKNEKEQQDAKAEVATIEKSTFVAEVFNSPVEVEEQVKLTSKEANKSTKKRTYSIGDLKKSSKQEKKTKPLIEDPTPFEIPSAFIAPNSESSSITIKSYFNNSTLEAETKINKNKNEKQNSDVKEVETIEQSEPIALLLSSAMEVDSEVKLISKEAKNSTKTVADIIKPSKELKKNKISFKEPTPAKIEEMETNEQSEPMTQLLNTAIKIVSQVKLISIEDKNLSKTGICKIDESKQLEKTKVSITEPTHFEDTIAPKTLNSESPSETIKSALINPIHKTSENSDLKLNNTTLAFTETKADNEDIEEKQTNPNIEEEATTEQAESKKIEVLNTTMEVSCLNQVEEPVEPTSKVKCLMEQKDPETLIQEPTPFEDPIVVITPHNDSSFKTFKNPLTKSTPENPTKPDLDLECKKVASVEPIIDTKLDPANVEEVAIIEAAEPIAKAFSTEIDVKYLNEVRKQVKSISIEANNSTVTETCPIIPDEITRMPPRALEQDKSFAEVSNTTMEVAETEVNSTTPKIACHNTADLIKSDNTTATSSMVVTLNEEQSVNNLIDLPKAQKLSSPFDTPTKKEDVLQRKLDISISEFLKKQELQNSTAQSKDDNHLIKKSVETFPKLKRPFSDGVDVVENDPVGRRRTSEVDGSELSFTNSLELDFTFVYDDENFADQSRQQPSSIQSEPQQSLSEIMLSGNRGQDDEDKLGQDDEDKLHPFNTKLALEPVPTSSPNENDENYHFLEEIYEYLPTSALPNGPENVSGANSESAGKPKIDVKKSDFIPKEVDTLKASFEDGKTSEAGEKHTVDVGTSEYELNNTPTSTSSQEKNLMSPKTKRSRAHVIKLLNKTTPEKEESPKNISVSKLKSQQKPFWKQFKTPTKPKVLEENSESTKLNTSTSVISLPDSPYTMDDVKSLRLNLDEIFEEKHTKTSLKTENKLTESNLIDVDSKNQVSNSLSPKTDDLFDRLKNEAPVNKILKPVIEDSLSLKIEKNSTINSSTHQINETKTQSLALVSSIASNSLKLDEQNDKPNKSLPNKINIMDQRTLNSNNSNPLEKNTTRSCNELDETQKTCLESNTDKKTFNLNKIDENKKNCPQVNEIDLDLQNIVSKETANQSPISVVENSLLIKSTEITTKNKTTSKHLTSKTDATVEVVPSMPSSSALMVKATNSIHINQCLENKIPDPSENAKTNQSTSEKNVVETSKSSLKKFSLSNNVQQQISSSEIPVTSTVVVVSSINPISTTPVKPESLVASGLSTTNKTPSSCKKVLEQSFVTKTIDPSEKINEPTQPVVAKKIAIPSTLTLKRNSAFNVVTKGQEPSSKIFCTGILTKPVPVSSMSAIPTSSVNQMILKPCPQKTPVKVIYPKKPIMQDPVSETRTVSCVSEIHRTPENKKNVDESKSSLKRYPSLSDATKDHEPPSKILRSENSTMSVSLQHQVSPSTLSQKSAPKIPYFNFTTSSPNVSNVKTPVRNETVTKSSMLQKNSTIQIASPSSQKLVESVLKQSATFSSHSPKNSKTMTPVHTTEKSYSVAPYKTVTPIRTPGHTNYSDKPRPTPAPTSKSHNVQPGTTMSKPSNSGSRTLNALSADLKRVNVDVEKIKNDLGKLPEIDTNYIVHKRRKFLLGELDNKQKELNELKKKYQEYEKHTRMKAHSERKPIDKDHPQHHHQYYNQQHRPNVSQPNDSRPHSERQFSKPNTSGSGNSSHVERHKERNHTYVNKFSELDKINFVNKNYQSADTNSESKKLPPWEPKQLTADEIIRTLHTNKKRK